MIVDRELCLIPLLKERIRSEWDLKEWVMIDLFFEDDVGKDQRIIQVRLRGKKPAVLLEDANDEDVNYGFDDVRRGGAGGAAVDRGQSARPGQVQIRWLGRVKETSRKDPEGRGRLAGRVRKKLAGMLFFTA